MAYDVANYVVGEGHQSFTAEGPVEGTVDGAGAPPGGPATPPAPVPAAAAPAAKVEPEGELIEAQAPSDAPVALAVPDFIPLSERTEAREKYVADFAQVAAESGIRPELAQGILDQVIEAASTLQYVAADEHTTDDDARAQVVQMFGKEDGEKLIRAAQKNVQALGPAVAEYLDRTNLGNDVAVLVALSQAGFSTMSPAKAKEALEATMKEKGYLAGDRRLVLKVAALSRVANREGSPEDQLNAAARKAANPVKPQSAGQAQYVAAQKEAGDARAELNALAGKRSLTIEERARWATLVAQVSR